jgi:hypothetical protein
MRKIFTNIFIAYSIIFMTLIFLDILYWLFY